MLEYGEFSWLIFKKELREKVVSLIGLTDSPSHVERLKMYVEDVHWGSGGARR